MFPPGSGVRPLYIVLSVRKTPGTVTGRGQDIDGTWLAGAGSGLGSPIPKGIADQLRRREFRSFDAFREAFWRAVAANPELSGQFVPDNIQRMKNGYAPKARRQDHIGKKRSFELHHVDQVSEGGEVYNIDNLRVTTPKNHIDIHRS